MRKQVAQKHSDVFNNLQYAKYYYGDLIKEGYMTVVCRKQRRDERTLRIGRRQKYIYKKKKTF